MVLIGQDLPLKTRGIVDPAEDSPSMLDQRDTKIVINCIQIRGHLHNLHKLPLVYWMSMYYLYSGKV